MTVYIDANIFVYSVLNFDERGEISRKILSKVIKNEIEACTSLLTWDEFIHALRKRLAKEDIIFEGKNFLKYPNLRFLRCDEDIILEAQKLFSNYKIKPRDAIHAATAIIHGVKEMVSDDPDFDVLKEIKRIKLEKFK